MRLRPRQRGFWRQPTCPPPGRMEGAARFRVWLQAALGCWRGSIRALEPACDGLCLARWYADPSGWWRDPELLHDLVGALAELHRDAEPNAVVGIASRGMQVGPLVAQRLKIGFVEIRKDLSQHLHHRPTFFGAATPPDYAKRDLILSTRRGLIAPRDRVVLVDDWIETGAQAQAAARLVEDSSGSFVGAAVIVDEATAAVRRALNVRGLLSAASSRSRRLLDERRQWPVPAVVAPAEHGRGRP
jgi:adenine phosphoribosyltransferase